MANFQESPEWDQLDDMQREQFEEAFQVSLISSKQSSMKVEEVEAPSKT